MTLQGLDNPNIPGASSTFNSFVAGVRLYMRDYPELNRLVAGEESSNRMIAFSVMEALSDFTSKPPDLGVYTFETFMQKGWAHYLRIGTICKLLEQIGLLQTRNNLNFAHGNIQVSVADKTPVLQNWIQILSAKWDTWTDRVKVGENISRAMGAGEGVNSEYFAIHGYFSRSYF
jgi:hypothetical protein